jgi:hypothetical protein
VHTFVELSCKHFPVTAGIHVEDESKLEIKLNKLVIIQVDACASRYMIYFHGQTNTAFLDRLARTLHDPVPVETAVCFQRNAIRQNSRRTRLRTWRTFLPKGLTYTAALKT